jgi:hypothetical protein
MDMRLPGRGVIRSKREVRRKAYIRAPLADLTGWGRLEPKKNYEGAMSVDFFQAFF